jgi:hypothetical protein
LITDTLARAAFVVVDPQALATISGVLIAKLIACGVEVLSTHTGTVSKAELETRVAAVRSALIVSLLLILARIGPSLASHRLWLARAGVLVVDVVRRAHLGGAGVVGGGLALSVELKPILTDALASILDESEVPALGFASGLSPLSALNGRGNRACFYPIEVLRKDVRVLVQVKLEGVDSGDEGGGREDVL